MYILLSHPTPYIPTKDHSHKKKEAAGSSAMLVTIYMNSVTIQMASTLWKSLKL
jgi:hypothetical protein